MPSELLKYPVRPELLERVSYPTPPGARPRAAEKPPETPPVPQALAAYPSPPPGVGGSISEFGYTLAEIQRLDGLITGDLTNTFNITADPELILSDRYEIGTDNAGTGGHTVTGPNLNIRDMVKDQDVLVMRSIGQLAIQMREAAAVLGITGVAHALQLRRKSTTTASGVGFGTGIQFYLADDAGTEIEAGNIQVDFAAPNTGAAIARLVFKSVIGGTVGTTLFNTTSVGNFLGAFKILATGGLGAGNTVARTTLAAPGTVVAEMPVFNASGVLVGSVPIYNAASFS